MKHAKTKRMLAVGLLLCLLISLSACQKQTLTEQFQALSQALNDRGYPHTIIAAPTLGRDFDVPIYDDSVWYDVLLDNDEYLLVYFDSSNRAKQLAEQFCDDPSYGKCVAYGLRYIILYQGEDAAILQMLDELAASL